MHPAYTEELVTASVPSLFFKLCMSMYSVSMYERADMLLQRSFPPQESGLPVPYTYTYTYTGGFYGLKGCTECLSMIFTYCLLCAGGISPLQVVISEKKQ